MTKSSSGSASGMMERELTRGSLVAKGEKGGNVDFAETLQAAKRWVRNQEKWSSPYYWGTFVLVGPN